MKYSFLRRWVVRSILSWAGAALLACVMVAWTAAFSEGPPKTPNPTDEQVARRHGLKVEQVRLLHSNRKLTNAVLMRMPTERVERVLEKLSTPRPDEPLAAAKFRQLVAAGGPKRNIPPNALGKAIRRVEQMRAAVPKNAVKPAAAPKKGLPIVAAVGSQTASGHDVYAVAGMPVGPLINRPPAPAAGKMVPAVFTPDPSIGQLRLELSPLPRPPAPGLSVAPGLPVAAAVAGVSPPQWKWLGPGNIGGRTRSIVVHPKKPNIIWAGSVAGGIWKTINGGDSWSPLADFMASLNVSCLTLDPTNPDVLYAGTGEGFYNLDAFRGAGIFKSTDGGASWKQLPETTGSDYYYVNRLALAADGKTLLAATNTGLFRSTTAQNDDVSTITFEAVQGVPQANVLDVKFHPKDSKRGVAGGRGGTAYYSTDGGANWKQATALGAFNPGETFAGRVELTYARANPDVVYASVDYNNGSLYRSQDGGVTYDLRSGDAEYLSSQGWYGNAIWAGDNKDETIVIVGGVDLYRSTDGGATLTQISDWSIAPASAHADHHAIVSHPNYNSDTNPIVYFGNDGGIYRNDDVRHATTQAGWHSLNNNYGVTQFYGAAGNKTSGRIVGGAQDNGTLRYAPPPGQQTGPQGWKAMFGGDGGASAADPVNSQFMYGEYVYLQIHRSVDGGESSSYIFGGSSPIKDAGDSGKALFIAPFLLDPVDPNTMLAGGASLWRSTNVRAQTPAWKAILSPGNGLISTAAAARSAGNTGTGNTVRSDRVWVGYTDGVVKRSTNGDAAQPTFARVGVNGDTPLPERYCTRIRIDPTDVKRVFATFSGYQSGNVWMTVDEGNNWKNVGAGLPEVPVYDIAMHPSNPEFVYAATEVGIFASDDGGTNWFPTSQGPANVAVFEFFWIDKVLVAATHGRGIFWIDLSGAPTVASSKKE